MRIQEPDELVAVTHAVGVRPEARVVGELGEPEHGADRAEQSVVSPRDHQLAVARREDLVRRDHREAGALAGRDRAVGQIAREVVGDVTDRRLVQRDVDDTTLAGALALEQRGKDAEGRPRARPLVDQRRSDPHTWVARLPGDRDEPARGLHERVVARFAGERPGVPIGTHRAVDEPRVRGAESLGTEPQLLGEPGAQALQEDVRALDEPQERLASSRVPER